MEQPKCMNPKCSRKASTRGVCWTCYNTMSRMVKAGETTWKQLETAGTCLPRVRLPHTEARKWIENKVGIKKGVRHGKAAAAPRRKKGRASEAAVPPDHHDAPEN